MSEKPELISCEVTWFYTHGIIALGIIPFITEARFTLPLFVLLYLVNYFWVGRAKGVKIEGSVLLISNFFKKVKVEFSNVKTVRLRANNSMMTVWIEFHEPTAFGTKVYFIAQEKFTFAFWNFMGSRNKLIDDLEKKIGCGKYAENNGSVTLKKIQES